MGVRTRLFPPGLVDEVIAEAVRTERRHRSLPARVMANFSIGIALCSEGVLAQLTDRLPWASATRRRPSRHPAPFSMPSTSCFRGAASRLASASGSVRRSLG